MNSYAIFSAITYLVLFIVLALENLWLNRALKDLFGPELLKQNFKNETMFLNCTLLTFSLSYILAAMRELTNQVINEWAQSN